jgi:hypothetical protein
MRNDTGIPMMMERFFEEQLKFRMQEVGFTKDVYVQAHMYAKYNAHAAIRLFPALQQRKDRFLCAHANAENDWMDYLEVTLGVH